MRVFAGIVIAVGILIAGLSGLCSLIFLGTAMTGGGGSEGLFYGLGMVAVIGGIPFAVGVGLILMGRAALRRARDEDI